MNEIILTGNTALGTTPLGRKTAAIIKLANNQIRDEKQIAVRVAEVNRDEMAVNAGFKNTAEWAAEYLGFSKSKVSRYVSITNRFFFVKVTDEQGRNYWDIFTLSQMQEMINATDEQLQHITPDMTVKEIREYLSYVDISTEDTADEESTEETTNANTHEFNDITVALSFIKKAVLEHEGAPALIRRVGDTFIVVC